jgi:hypothetical protein
MNYTILLHTHSSYSYLWPIINDYIKKYNFKKILAYDSIPENATLPVGFDKYIQYDASQIFSTRLVPILEQITEEFVFLIYDVDIIINIDESALKSYIEIMKENNIDRVCSAVFNGNGQLLKNNVGLCNLNLPLISPSNHFVPVDCSPVIWNRGSFLIFLKSFPNRSYGALELDTDVIRYCKSKVKCYGIQYTPNLKILYNRGLTNSDKLSFLHITTKGRFLIPLNVYHDYEVYLKEILQKYNLNISLIGVTQAHQGCFNFKKL